MENWKTFYLSELANVTMGQSPDGSTYNTNGIGLPFVQGNADLGDTFPRIRMFTTDPKRFSEIGDILFTVRAPVGALNLNNQRISIGRGISAISEFDNSNYLYYYLQFNRIPFQRLEQGTTFTEINQREIKRLKIFAPKTYKERRAIASVLSKVDEAIAAVERSVKSAERLKKALMQNLLTGKLKPNGEWRGADEFYTNEKFGKVPIDWEVKKWGDLISLEYGKSLNQSVKIGNVPVFGTNGQIGFTDKPIYDSNGIIVGRKGAYREVHYSEVPFWVIDTAFYVVPKFDFDLHWAYFALKQLDINRFDSGSAIPSTNKKDVYFNKVLFPLDKTEQIEITNHFKRLNSICETKQTKIQTLQRLKKSLMQNLLTGKMRLNVEKIKRLLAETND